MKLIPLQYLFLMLSLGFILFTLFVNAPKLNDKRVEKIRLSKIQKVFYKSYMKRREVYVPNRSVSLAQKKIDAILKKNMLRFPIENGTKKRLTKLVKVINRVDDNVILAIEVYMRSRGSQKKDLITSQARADELKAYFTKRATSLPLITAIGYGSSLSVKDKRVLEGRVELTLRGYRSE